MSNNDDFGDPEPYDPDSDDTWHMEVSFKPREHVSGEPWLYLEPFSGPDLPILHEQGFLGIEFENGTDLETVVEIGRLLRKHATMITYTGPIEERFGGQLGRGGMRRFWDREVVEKIQKKKG